MPLWAATALVLLCYLYIHSNVRETLKEFQLKNQSSAPPVENEPDFIFHNNLLWLEGEKAPYCPICYEVKGNKIHVLLKTASNNVEEWEYFECHNCETRTDHSPHPFDEPF